MSAAQKFLGSFISLALIVSCGQSAGDEGGSGPYQAIVDRNVFALKPPPPPAPDPASIKPPAPKVALLGITTLLGKKRALLKFTPPAKPGEAAKETSLMLAEGQRDGEIEVLQVDEKAKSVTIDNFGTPTTLTLDKDAPKAPVGPPPGGPVAPGMPPSSPLPSGIPIPSPMPSPALRTIPTRTLRSPSGGGLGGTGESAAAAPMGGMMSAGASSTTPTGQMSLEEQNAVASQRSAEESVLLYEANRLKNEELRAAGAKIPPMPQHPFLRGGTQQ
jgi:hypothetical protein